MIKIELDVNGFGDWKVLDYNEGTFPVALQKSIVNLKDISRRAGEFTYTISIPLTPNNKRCFNFVDNPNNPNKFNKSANYMMRIFSNNTIIAEGLFKLSQISNEIEGSLIGQSIAWFDNLKNKSIRDLDLGELDFTGDSDIITYMDGRTDICYPLVHWGGFENRMSQDDYVYGSRKTSPRYTYNNFKPAVFVKHIFTQMMNEAGIGISGEFLNSEEFNKLIILFGGDENFLNWVNLTNAETVMSSDGIYLHIDEDVSGQVFSFAKYTDTWTNAPLIIPVKKVFTTLPSISGYSKGDRIIIGTINLSTNDIDLPELYGFDGTNWELISNFIIDRQFFYIEDISNFNLGLSVGTSKYFLNFGAGMGVIITQINIDDFTSEAYSMFTGIRGAVTKFAFQDIVVDEGNNMSPVNQGKFTLNGSVLSADSNYEARDIRVGDWIKSNTTNKTAIISSATDKIQGDWTVSSLDGDFTSENIRRYRDQYEVPVDGAYDISLGYGQFSSRYNTTLINDTRPINSYFNSDFYGNLWKLLNAHVIMAVRNYSTYSLDVIDWAKEIILSGNGEGFNPSSTNNSNVLNAIVRYGNTNTLYDLFTQTDLELFRGDDISLVHVCFCGGSLKLGGWENSFTGTNSGTDSFDRMSIRLTEDIITETVTENGISTSKTYKPQVYNSITDKYEESYNKLRVNRILPDISCQDFIRGLMDIKNLYWIYDSNSKNLNVIPFNNIYGDNKSYLEIDEFVEIDSETITPINIIRDLSVTYSDDTNDEFQHLLTSVGSVGILKNNTNNIYNSNESVNITLPFSNTAGVNCVFVPALETYTVYSAMYTQTESAVPQDRFNNYYEYTPRIVNLVDYVELTDTQSFGIDRPYIYINATRYPVKQAKFDGILTANSILSNYKSVYNIFDAKEQWTLKAYINESTWNNLRLDRPIRYKGQLFYPLNIGAYIPNRTQLTNLTLIKL